MFSGKTTVLLRILKAEPAEAILIVKHGKDTRYSRTAIATHDGEECEAVTATCAADILERAGSATEVVAIDEGHFYDDALPATCTELAKRGKRVIVTALDMNMWGKPFPTIETLKRAAGVIRQQRAECAQCGKPATHTHRKTPIVDCNLVGGSEDFEPRCRNCWSPPPEPPIPSAEMA